MRSGCGARRPQEIGILWDRSFGRSFHSAYSTTPHIPALCTRRARDARTRSRHSGPGRSRGPGRLGCAGLVARRDRAGRHRPRHEHGPCPAATEPGPTARRWGCRPWRLVRRAAQCSRTDTGNPQTRTPLMVGGDQPGYPEDGHGEESDRGRAIAWLATSRPGGQRRPRWIGRSARETLGSALRPRCRRAASQPGLGVKIIRLFSFTSGHPSFSERDPLSTRRRRHLAGSA
jgi:hypothetical protein